MSLSRAYRLGSALASHHVSTTPVVQSYTQLLRPCSQPLSLIAGRWLRHFATIEHLQSEIDAINDKFVEARDEIEYAQEDAETVYFNDSAQQAKAAVKEVLDQYNAVLSKLDDGEKGKLQRSMGLKMEQLKAEVEQLDHLHA